VTGPICRHVVDDLVHRVAQGEIRLGQALVERVGRPRGVLEPPVGAVRRNLRATCDTGELCPSPIPAFATALPWSRVAAIRSAIPTADGSDVGSAAAIVSSATSGRVVCSNHEFPLMWNATSVGCEAFAVRLIDSCG